MPSRGRRNATRGTTIPPFPSVRRSLAPIADGAECANTWCLKPTPAQSHTTAPAAPELISPQRDSVKKPAGRTGGLFVLFVLDLQDLCDFGDVGDDDGFDCAFESHGRGGTAATGS